MSNLINNIITNCNGFNPDSSLSVISVSGKDNKSFLQGQLTNNLDNLSTNQYFLACYCTPQGKVIAQLQVIQIDNTIYLLICKELTKLFIDQISKYILMADVKIELETEAKIISSVGSHAKKILDNYKCSDLRNVRQINKNSYILNFSTTQVEGCKILILNNDKYKYDASNEDINYSSLIDLMNLQTRLKEDDVGKYIPQVLNSDIIESVSYKKGCYTGQEVIARTHYLGNIKKRVYLISFKNDNGFTKEIVNSDGESVGEIIGELCKYEKDYLSHCILRDTCDFEDLIINENKVYLIKAGTL